MCMFLLCTKCISSQWSISALRFFLSITSDANIPFLFREYLAPNRCTSRLWIGSSKSTHIHLIEMQFFSFFLSILNDFSLALISLSRQSIIHWSWLIDRAHTNTYTHSHIHRINKYALNNEKTLNIVWFFSLLLLLLLLIYYIFNWTAINYL